MATLCTDISLPRKIEEYVEARNRARALLKQAEDNINASAEELVKFLPMYGLPAGARPRDSLKGVYRELDQRFWRVTFRVAGFMQYMDQKAKADFDRELDTNPPEYTMENLRSVLVSAASDAENMYRRGLVNVFLGLPEYYRTNTKEPFKVGRKSVIEFMFDAPWGVGTSLNYHKRALVNDIDRIFKTLDGVPHVPQSFESALNGHFKTGYYFEVGAYEDDYYIVKAFKNTNMHIEFKRQDLLDKANKLIAEYYADGALPDGRKAA